MHAAMITISAQLMTLKLYDKTSHKIIETVHYRVLIGQDIYHDSSIKAHTLHEICRGFLGFQLKIEEFDITDVAVYATASIREAINSTYIKDQVRIRTGYSWNWLDHSEERMYHHLAVASRLTHYKKRLHDGALLIDIASGSVQVTMYQEGKLVFSRHVKLGPLRIQELVTQMENQIDRYQDLIEDYILSKIESLKVMMTTEVKHLIVFGTDLRSFSQLFSDHQIVTVDTFKHVYTQLQEKERKAFEQSFSLTREAYVRLLPALIILNTMVQWTQASTLHRSESDLCDGLIASQNRKTIRPFEKDMMTAVEHIADRFHCSKANNENVMRFATRLFDRLQSLHGMSQRERLLLRMASQLRNIGNLVSMNQHYLHSYYLVDEMEVIGLSNREKEIIAHCVRYHSTVTPLDDALHFQRLPEDQAVVISKLSAILRIADALDDSMQQKVKQITVSIRKGTVHLKVYSNDEITLENWVLMTKAAFFEFVFGMTFTFKEVRQHGL